MNMLRGKKKGNTGLEIADLDAGTTPAHDSSPSTPRMRTQRGPGAARA